MSQKQIKAGAQQQKKQISTNLSPEEQDWIRQQLANYQPYVQALHGATFAQDAEEEEALSPIFAQSEQAQLALVKDLGQLREQEAADLLTAIQELTTIKAVRKEARRSLLRLEGAKIAPRWTMPSIRKQLPITTSQTTAYPPRFWKGYVSNTQNQTGMIQIILVWEEGEGYRSARIMGLLLDYALHGIQDFFYEANLSKTQAERHVEKMRTGYYGDMSFRPCTLGQARQMLEKGLEVMAKNGAQPPLDFNRYRHIVDMLLLNTADDQTRKEDTAAMTERPTPDAFSMSQGLQSLIQSFLAGDIYYEETVHNFFDAWNTGRYGEAYDLLASDSPLRQGLSRDAWIELREQWRAEAQPNNFALVAVDERDLEEEEEEEDFDEELDEDEDEEEDFDEELDEDEDEEEGIVDLFWSLEMNDTPLSERLPELPKATITYGETRRHWFWSSYNLRSDDEHPLLVSMTDEGAEIAKLPGEEISSDVEELVESLEEIIEVFNKKQENEEELAEEEELSLISDSLEDLNESSLLAGKALSYYDALIFQKPDTNSEWIEKAAGLAEMIQDFERAASYQQVLAERFPERKAKALAALASSQQQIAQTLEEKSEPATRFLQLAEQNLHASLELERNAMTMILLAQLLSHEYAKFDEAENLLREAEKLSPNSTEAVMIAVNYGMIAEYRNDTRKAIDYYRQATTIAPDFPNLWNNLGYLQMSLGEYDEAEKSFLQSIDNDPENSEAYIHLADLYTQVRQDLDGAEDVLLQGFEVATQDVGILGKLAEVYINKGDLKEAQRFLEEAEELSPDSSYVQDLRAALNEARSERRRTRQTHKTKKHKK